LAAGAIWGLLPCGLVYSALATAATRADAYEAATFMMAFGFGTLPALTMAGLATAPRSKPMPAAFRLTAGLLLLALGAWVCLMSLQGLTGLQDGTDPHQHHHEHHPSSS